MEDRIPPQVLWEILKKSRGEPAALMDLIACIQDVNAEGREASYPGIVRRMWPEEWGQDSDKVRFEKKKWDLLCKRRREINARLFASELCFQFYIGLLPGKRFKIVSSPAEIQRQRARELEWNLSREREKQNREKILAEIVELNHKFKEMERPDGREVGERDSDAELNQSSRSGKTDAKAPGTSRTTLWALGLAVIVGGIAGLALKDVLFRANPPGRSLHSEDELRASRWADERSIAVLPFANLSDDPEQDNLAEGLTENIITALSQIPELFVIARDSSLAYKGKNVKAKEIAEELGVRHVLEGSVQREGDRVRVNVQLIDTADEHNLWAQRFDRKFSDLFELQDELTLKIAIALSVKLTEGDEARVRHRSTRSLEAWGLAARALGMGVASKESATKARALLEQAVEIDPNYAWAWSRLALTHYWDARFGYSPSREESWKRGYELAKKAVALDESLPEGHVTLALLHLFRRQYDEAIAEGRRAVALGPNDATTLTRVAQVMHYSGNFEEALNMVKRAQRLNPHYEEVLLRFLGGAYRFTGQTEKAIEAFEEYRERKLERKYGRGGAWIACLHLASLYGELGLQEKARERLREAQEFNPDVSLQYAQKYLIFRFPEDSERVLDGLRKAGLR